MRTASQLVDEIASHVLPPQVSPFWLARPASERFCSDRGRTRGHCTSKGRLGSKLGFVGFNYLANCTHERLVPSC